MRENFISALVQGTTSSSKPIGTSLAAPQIAGVLALLQQAYPNCTPKILAKAILKTGQGIEKLGGPGIAGKGSVDALSAFNIAKTQDFCNAEPVLLKK